MGSPIDHIPTPTIVLMGCRAWDATPVKSGSCPVCGPGVRAGHQSTYCARCDSLSPRRESQVLAARVGLRARSEAESAARGARDDLRRVGKANGQLSEALRRRIWMGYSRSGVNSRNAEVANRAKVGRDWLRSIGQEPDFSLILDSHGKVVGRMVESAECV